MADRIKGIVVEIGGDTAKLSAATKKVNGDISSTKSLLKDVERLLKLDPKNTELLAQKQRLLGQAVEETKDKLKTLTEASEAAAKTRDQYDAFQAAFTPIQTEIDKTGDTLKALKKQMKETAEAEGPDSDKYKSLAAQAKETEAKVKELKAQGEACRKEFGNPVSTEQWEGLQREIIDTEQSLKKLEDQAKTAKSALSELSDVAGKISTGAQKVASSTRGVSTAAAGGIASLAALAVNAGKAADDLNTMSKQSGFGTDEIQKWQYAADRMDVSVETIVKSAQKMKKNMVATSADTVAAWERLGVSVTNQDGSLRDANTVFYEAVDALSQVSNETERDVLAMQLFGKSADEMAGFVDDGGAALKAMGEEAEASGLILSQDALDNANKFNDGLDTLKAKAEQAFLSSGATLAETLIPSLETLVEKISGVLEWVAGLDSGTLTMIGTILLVVAAISPLASLIGGVAQAVQGVSSVVSFLTSGPLAGLNLGIVGIIALIVALVALIATKGDEIQALLQKVDDFLQGVFLKDWTEVFGPGLGDVLNGFFANLKNIWDSIKQIFDGIIDFIRGVFTGDWERAWTGVQEIFSGVFSGLAAIAKVPINGIISLLNGAISGINSLIGGLNGIGFKLPDWLGGGSFKINIPQIGKIPYLAKGGSLTGGSAIVGEAGPELLTVGSGRAVVQPLSGNYGHIESLLGDISGKLGGGQSGPIVIQVTLDGRIVGQAVYDYIGNRGRANGS